jgi:hypothetical protein
VNQRSCVADAADGYTSASLVAFVRNGQIVDELTDVLKDLINALEAIKGAIVELDRRVRILEHE